MTDRARWKYVPEEPTETMIEAGHDADWQPGEDHNDFRRCYKAMLAAAPPPPAPSGECEMAQRLRDDVEAEELTGTELALAGVAEAVSLIDRLTRELAEAMAAVRRLALCRHVRLTYGGGEAPSGGSCKLCRAEWDEDQPEQHIGNCLASRNPDGESA